MRRFFFLHLSTALLILSCLYTNAQILQFDSLTTKEGSNKSIIWLTSTWGGGFGHKIYNIDPGNKTDLRFAARHNSATWTDMLTLTSDGKVGIGDMDPQVRLSVDGDVLFKTKLTVTGDIITGNYTTNSQVRIKPTLFKGSPAGIKLGDASNPLPDVEFVASSYAAGFGTRIIPVDIRDGYGTTLLKFQSRTNTDTWSDVLTINNRLRTVASTGRMLINDATDDGSSALRVNGDIVAKRLKVIQTEWPDYVFAPNYILSSLQDVEKYIKTNQHLPGIPSAVEVEKEGLDVGEMNKKLLQKVEELTLYMIEQQKQIKLLQSQLSSISNQQK